MRYVSTRGEAPVLGFCDVLLAGLARDGGLYVPETWPQLTPEEIADLAGRRYAEIALRVIRPFIAGEIAEQDLREMIEAACARFRHPAMTPLVQLGPNHWLLELFHGPTLAFKDVAMQLLARLMEHVLTARRRRATIVGATSGDTGGAAIEAFRGSTAADIFILHPHGRVSEVQRRQMTTIADDNVHAVAIRGTFDDCQALVKGMFNHFEFRERMALSGVNSINWARIMAQVVYYFAAATALGAPARAVAFTVPTGNFGDIFAGFVAMRMGLPVSRLIIATNVNDILARTLATGHYRTAAVIATDSPSMDIQLSSNFERLLFEAGGRDAAMVRRSMNALAQSGGFVLDEATGEEIAALFEAGSADEQETRQTIYRIHDETGHVVDPHTAVGLAVAGRHLDGPVPMVTLATAHPAKFPDAVERAIGIRPGLPPWLSGLMHAEERFTVLDNDLAAVERFIEAHGRAAREDG